MIAQTTLKEKQLKDQLKKLRCVCTSEETGTGTIWKTEEGMHFTVPFACQGFYADWMLTDLIDQLAEIKAESVKRKRS